VCSSSDFVYAGRRRTPEEVANFFKSIPETDDIQVFEPREFIEAGEHVTVLGWEKTMALDTQKLFETEWVHVFTVKSGKITRWRGFSIPRPATEARLS
jgi:ketosteroid isomerase-like protein